MDLGDALIRIGPALVIVIVVLAGIAVAVNVVASSGHGRETAIAVIRAVVQLAAFAAILAVVIKHLWASVLFLLFMSVVAAWTSATRITGRSRPPLQTALLCLLPVAAPTAVVTLAVALLGVVPAKGIAIIPTAGIMLGNAMIATSLAARHAHDELRSRHGEVEAALSLGFLTRDARLEVVRPAAATALIPGIDQTRSVGLVTIPGSFVGMVLGGASTTAAAIMQLFVLVALLAVAAIAVLTTTELVSRELL
ncbi:MAG TPA: ABC transporter permease [Gordonia sp. (in: high G+C Gram-positive bacteria)]|uniref:ABC transporter permease n=1 Tax=unclassified Gordonia (in: high G+C Gram-positive bacteria) TaxID=2657482 RepID=UPI0025C3B6B4|nr:MULTISPECIES: ABC transporter permease [unclassified Gordonia (in: high G+C Gram-positive bacteria)]HNP55610.1 ABC transporter permease [Gordonia sp. (in: high G+C Gram-positive bacteria)]HRC50511.1 ABC transporter permease [Gordonia sp. (in: high G+C Gram-positive bacteria)]